MFVDEAGTSQSIHATDKTLKVSKIEYKMVPGKYTTISSASASSSSSSTLYTYPQIINYLNVESMKMANAVIRDELYDIGCEDKFEVKSMNVNYNQNDIFDVSTRFFTDACNSIWQGAYPVDSIKIQILIDMKTGERVYFEDIFADYERDEDEILKTIYKTLIEESAGLSADAGTCNTLENLKSVSHWITLSASTSELIVTADYPHVAEACTETVTIPVKKLLPFTSDDSILRRIK